MKGTFRRCGFLSVLLFVLSLFCGIASIWLLDKITCWVCVANANELDDRLSRIDLDKVDAYLHSKSYQNDLLSRVHANKQLVPCTSQYDALETWPDDVELMLTLPPDLDRIEAFQRFLLPSLAMFWPKSRSHLLIVTDSFGYPDEEAYYSKEITKLAIDFTSSTRISTPRWEQLEGLSSGIIVSHWVKFWADNFTQSKYVGFLDGDGVFTTRVTRQDLFDEENRPLVRGVYGPLMDKVNSAKATSNFVKILGAKQPFRCRTYFPVIVKVEHLSNLRKHITERMGFSTFDEAYLFLHEPEVTVEFDLICGYLWYHKREHYHWIINEALPGWRGSVDGLVEDPDSAGLTPFFKHSRPHVAIHFPYEEASRRANSLRAIIATGVCYSLTSAEIEAGRMPEFCTNVKRNDEKNIFEWQFERQDFSSVPWAMNAHVLRLQNNDKCPHEWQGVGFELLENVDNPVKGVSKFERERRIAQWLVAVTVVLFICSIALCLKERHPNYWTRYLPRNRNCNGKIALKEG